jgi:hypothetical protein
MPNGGSERAKQAVAALKLNGANREVATHWLSRWHDGKPPRIRSFNQDKVWQHGPGVTVYELRKDSLRCVTAGGFLRLAVGFDLTGQDVLSITPAEDREERMAICHQLVQGAVGMYYRLFKSKSGPEGLAQGVSLPFSNADANGARYFMTHTNWRPVGHDWMEGNVALDLGVPMEKNLISYGEPAQETALV